MGAFPSTCWKCAHNHTQASGVTRKGETEPPQPKDGDATLCIRCGAWNIFDTSAKGGLRPPTDREKSDLAEDPLCRLVMRAWLAAQVDIAGTRRH